uniref:Natural cytotoxicity triggering receptor 1 n=1 Tax=Suricata suricatta TaxID=37032 RepID=A0A673U7G2_SURSU
MCLYTSGSEVEGKRNLFLLKKKKRKKERKRKRKSTSQCESPTAVSARLYPPHPAPPLGLPASASAFPSRIEAMTSTLTAVLCLEILSKPIIWAKPGLMVPKGKPAQILCQGLPGAAEYQLYFEGRLSAWQSPSRTRGRTTASFPISAMTLLTAGEYRCTYRSGELWSSPSDPLDLVVTELYDTPTLSVHPGPEVSSGDNVTFSCRLETATNMFLLLKEGGPGRPQPRYGDTQVEFRVGPVTTAHRGTYRCFGSYNNHAWSFPSEPVELLVTGDAGDTSLAPTEYTSFSGSWDPYLLTTDTAVQQDSVLWNHTAQNLLRMGLVFLVLVVLGYLLAEDWLCRRRRQEGAHRASSQERGRRFRTQ